MSGWAKCSAYEHNPKALRCEDGQGNAISFVCPSHMQAFEGKGIFLGVPHHSITCGTAARGTPETFSELVEAWGWWLSKPANTALAGACAGVALGVCLALIIGRLRRRRARAIHRTIS